MYTCSVEGAVLAVTKAVTLTVNYSAFGSEIVAMFLHGTLAY